jgi:poly [ADP-ribose] polymerase
MVTETKPAYKPWKVEYAKSSRSSCRACGKPIAKDAFRLAKIQPAHQFDGLMPQWHHASCVFHEEDEIKSLDEVDGLENLREADLQNLRKYIEGTLRASDAEVDKGKSVAPVAAPGGSGDNSGEYEIENAKSSRSVCKSCNQKIEKGHVRVATMVDNPRFRGKQPAWRHVKCFLELGWWTSPMAAMAGWNNLSVKDQAECNELAKHSPGVKEAKFVEKVESHEVGSKRKKDASKSPSPKKSPRLSRIKEKIAGAMSHKETSPVKNTPVAKKRSPKKSV